MPHPGHKIYPYLLRGKDITRAGRGVVCRRHLPAHGKGLLLPGGHHGLGQPRVLAWRLSNTLDASFCVEALEEALRRYDAPEIFNTDQGSQFTSEAFTTLLHSHGVAISMDGRGRWMDNVFIERLWRSVKYEEVYLKAYETHSGGPKRTGGLLRLLQQKAPAPKPRRQDPRPCLLVYTT